MSRPTVRAAMATVVITPSSGGELAGYAVPDRTAVGATDDLTATVWHLVDPNRDNRLVWVGLDVLAISDLLHASLTAAVRTRVGEAEVLVSATHTHCAPGSWCGTIHPILPATLDRSAVEEVAARVAAGIPDPEPTRLRWGMSAVDGLGTNRHAPDGDRDPSIGVLSCWQGAELTGLVVDHACHPTVLGPHHRGWSADWVGGMRRRLAAELASPVPVLFLQGAAGDVSTRFTRAARTPAEADRLGGLAAEGVLDALANSTDLQPDRGVAVSRESIIAPRRTSFDPAARITTPDRHLAQALADGSAALAALADDPGPASLRLPIADVMIAGRRYLTTPMELINRWGSELSSLAPNLRVVGYTDAYRGYLADADAHRSGHYEATSSFFDAPTSESIMAQLAARIR